MNYRRRRPKKKRKFEVDRHWGWGKNSKLDYHLKKEFKTKWKNGHWRVKQS